MSVQRVYVEKKPGFDVEARACQGDFTQNLGQPVKKVRLFNRYDVEGLSEADFRAAAQTVMSEGAADDVWYGELPDTGGAAVFAVEYLPGQYDQRADSAAQCIQLLTRGERPAVRCAKVYCVEGGADIAAIKAYVINPVDSREAALELPETLEMELEQPGPVAAVEGFLEFDEAAIQAYVNENGYAMTAADMAFAQNYFKTEGRAPTVTELRVLDTYWSDHCRHTTFLTKLENVTFANDDVSQKAEAVWHDYLDARREMGADKDICLMDVATMYPREAKRQGLLPNLDVSEEINACSIRHKVKTDGGEKDYLIMFKNETHNHPTEIEPFGGAATCLGGAIRDPLSGRAYVYQAMRVTGSADPRQSLAETMEHKLPQRKITKEAAHGYSSYGNQIGLATGQVSEVYHPGYAAKRLEIGAVIAAAPAENVVRMRPAAGDVVILIGGRTGRDGIGGATGSSKAHDERSVEQCGAEVQKGNPLTERKLQRLFRDPAFSKKVKRCNDFGAGGVCVAVGELADGLWIDLSAVPKKYEGLDGTELAISESQERMAVVVSPRDADAVLKLAAKENLEATEIARVTDNARLRMEWNGQRVVDLSREFVDSNGAPQRADAKVEQNGAKKLFDEEVLESCGETLLSLLSDLNICSQKGLVEMFDSTIGAGSVTMPLGGKHQVTPVMAMCAKVPCFGETEAATLMSWGMDPYLAEKSPFLGAAYAVIESVSKIVAAGGKLADCWLTLQEYFERMTGEPEKWGKPLGALLGAYWAQKELGVAAIGGKDSMSGTFKDVHVPPTLCSFCVAPTEAGRVVTPEFKQAGNKLYLLEVKRDEDGLPDFHAMTDKYAKLEQLTESGAIRSASAVGRGGYLAAAAKAALGNRIGAKLFSESKKRLTQKQYGSILVEAAELTDPDFKLVGELRAEEAIEACGEAVPLDKILQAYTAPLEGVFPTKTADKGKVETALCGEAPTVFTRYKTGLPRVVIPVFPGTNCEYDTAAAFARAGAKPMTAVLCNRTADEIEQSVRELESAIRASQIVVLPGGFSGGDEPDGSGKFIATIFRSGRIRDAVDDLLHMRDGLMLGICNGFQALVKLGLAPFGEIRDMTAGSPTLTYNNIGRHVSQMVRTRVTSVKSPWLQLSAPGDVHTVAVSHGEGRFVASEAVLDQLERNGQIATQYVDFSGKPCMEAPHNPNGSMRAVEGILSPDGRILGKMGHSERAGRHVAKNVPGEYDQKIFEGGVLYFR